MADNNEQVQAVDSTEEQWKNPELQKLEDDVNNLVDENSENNPEKLSVTLTTEFVKSIPADTAKSMLKLIKGKYQNGVPPQLTDLVTVLNSIVIEPNINTEELTNTWTWWEMYKKNLDTWENMDAMINSIKTKINKTMASIDNFPDNQELNKAKGALETIETIIDNPNSDNTKSLQKFILKNLPPESDDYKTFLKENFGPKWVQQKDPDKPDGYFGKNTIKWIDSCLTKLNNYIEEITKAKNIQEKANQEANKPDGVPTGNVDTRVDNLSTNVDYQALQSFAKLAEASEAASQAILEHQDKLKALIDNRKIDKELVNRVQENTESFLKWAGELKIYQSVGQLSNMISDYNSKSEQLNEINEEINWLKSGWDNENEITELKEQADNLKSEMDSLNLNIMEAKREYGVTMLWKDALQQKLNDGLPLAVNIIKDWILMINQMLLALDNNEESGNKELKSALKSYQDLLLTVSGFEINTSWEVVAADNAPKGSISQWTTIPPLANNLPDSYPFSDEEMKNKLWDWDKEVKLDINDISYNAKVDIKGNLCPIATASDKHLIWSNYPVMFENYQPCINYLWNKAQKAGLKVEIARNDKMKDYVLRSHGQWITIEPMLMNGDWISDNLSTNLKLLNLTNRLRSGKGAELNWNDPNLKITNEWLQVKKEWRGWMPLDLKSFGFTDEEIWNTRMWQRYKKYNNHENWNDDWDSKKKNSDYKRVTL